MYDNTNEIKFKVCTKCHRELKANEINFRKQKRGKYGLHSQCRECEREASRKWKKENAEKVKEYNQKYRKENKKKILEYEKRYRLENAEIIKERKRRYLEKNLERERQRKLEDYYKNKKERLKKHKEWLEKNKQRVLERQREYYKEHPDIFAGIRQRRRSRLKKVEHNYTWEEWENCKKYFDYKCCYCGEERELEQDHFIPLNNGGGYTTDNIVPACKSCNSSKRDRDFFEWYKEKPFYSKEREEKILEYLGYKIDNTKQLALF